MEVSGISLQKLPAFPAAGVVRTVGKHCHALVGTRSSLYNNGMIRHRFKDLKSVSRDGFADNNHLEYYNYGPKCGAKKEKEREKVSIKKKLKLLKGLSKNLSMFSGMGLGMESETGLTGEIQGKMISEASEILLRQLEKLRAEEKELKKKKKLEKRGMKAMKMSTMIVSDSSCSSSSESECGEVVSMNTLRWKEHITQTKIPGDDLQVDISTTPTRWVEQVEFTVEEKGRDDFPSSLQKSEEITNGAGISGMTEASTNNLCGTSVDWTNGSGTSYNMCSSSVAGATMGRASSSPSPSTGKIEVCMGGKCKKSGGAALLSEFQRLMGVEGAVEGCKCMGKCKQGPNVKVIDSVRTPSNPLFVGVGVEDVGDILTKFLGDDQTLSLAS